MKRKLLIVADKPNWAFDKIYYGLKDNCATWNVSVVYINVPYEQPDFDEFDLVFYLCDWIPERIIGFNTSRDKILLAIRSDVLSRNLNFYKDDGLIVKTVGGLVVANNILFEKFKGKHSFVKIAGGGVDTDKFTNVHKQLHTPLSVGWAGSRDNFGKSYRGLDLIEKACQILKYKFTPAYREDLWRTEDEMVLYYQNDIDIYIDLSIAAGRQNGLIEAGACGKALISTNVGIAGQLIEDGVNGFIIDRTLSNTLSSFQKVVSNINLFGSNIRKVVEEKWSWSSQTVLFENIFNEFMEMKNK